MPAVVSDASVLICLGAVGQLHFLQEFYHDIIVPDAVWHEVTGTAVALPGSKETVQAKQEGWLKVQTPGNQSLVSTLRLGLGAGEAEAIALASELRAGLLLIDEVEGRTAARGLGLVVVGTVGVLVRAKHARKVATLKPILDKLIQENNFRLSGALYDEVLREVGERP